MKIEKIKKAFMKKTGIIIILLLSLSLASWSLSGCETQNETLGTAVGAGTGFVLGALTGGPVGAILLTGVGAGVGFGIGYVTSGYTVVREGRPRGYSMLNTPYRVASNNEPVSGPKTSYEMIFKGIKGVLVSNLKISTIPKVIVKGKKVNLIMGYDVFGSIINIKDSEIKETRILEGLNGKIYYSHNSATGISKEGYYKTDLTVIIPKNAPNVFIYEAIVKVNDSITALTSRLVLVK